MVKQTMLLTIDTGVSRSRGIVSSFGDQKRLTKESHRIPQYASFRSV